MKRIKKSEVASLDNGRVYISTVYSGEFREDKPHQSLSDGVKEFCKAHKVSRVSYWYDNAMVSDLATFPSYKEPHPNVKAKEVKRSLNSEIRELSVSLNDPRLEFNRLVKLKALKLQQLRTAKFPSRQFIKRIHMDVLRINQSINRINR